MNGGGAGSPVVSDGIIPRAVCCHRRRRARRWGDGRRWRAVRVRPCCVCAARRGGGRGLSVATASGAVGKHLGAKRPGPIDHRRERGTSMRPASPAIYLSPICGKARQWDQIRSASSRHHPRTWQSHHRPSFSWPTSLRRVRQCARREESLCAVQNECSDAGNGARELERAGGCGEATERRARRSARPWVAI